jgi:hypothetical protein
MKNKFDVRCPACGRAARIRGRTKRFQCAQCWEHLKVCSDSGGMLYLAIPGVHDEDIRVGSKTTNNTSGKPKAEDKQKKSTIKGSSNVIKYLFSILFFGLIGFGIYAYDFKGLTGHVVNSSTGTPVSTAIVEIEGVTVKTNKEGKFSFGKHFECEKCVLTASHPKYGSNSVALPKEGRARILLQPVDEEKYLTPTSLVRLADKNGEYAVRIPANSLVQEDGGKINGNIHATLTVIDPSQDIRLMPGNLVTQDNWGNLIPIESFGAITVELWDDGNEKLNLAAAHKADISIPVAANIKSPPRTMPLYFFNEQAGHWIEEGSAKLKHKNGKAYYEGKISHFSTWNADVLFETVTLTGCVEDLEGRPVSSVNIIAKGSDYNAETTAQVDIEGHFEIQVKPNSTVLISGDSFDGSKTNTVKISVDSKDKTLSPCLILADSPITIKLTWNDQLKDLDSHFKQVISNDVDTQKVYVHYSKKGELKSFPYTRLDVDDRKYYGPEIITNFKILPGTYRYFVRNFTGKPKLGKSDAVVELNLDGEIYRFNVPPNHSEKDWQVFTLEVNQIGIVSVQ